MSRRKPMLRLVSIDDWCALYLDGKSIYQGHDLNLDHFFAVLQEHGVSTCMDFATVQGLEADQDKAEESGYLPDSADELAVEFL